jgi:hypothetical protein
MPVYQISGSWVSKDPRKLRKALRDLGVTNPEVTKIECRTSQTSRFADALRDVRRGQEIIVEIRDELQLLRHHISENPLADQLDTAIDALTEFEEIKVEVEVDFPTSGDQGLDFGF